MAITWNNPAAARVVAGVEQGMLEACETLLGLAVNQTPYVEHHLRNSGTTDVEVSGDKVSGVVSFNTPYARIQHENLTFNHPQPNTGAKFLEKPANRFGPQLQQIIAANIRQALS